MKKITFFTVFIMITLSSGTIAGKNLGSIIQFGGDVDITSLSTGRRMVANIGTQIKQDYKIRTGKKSFVEILLSNGTKIFIKEITVINISDVKLREKDSPTRIKILTGKVRVTIKNIFSSRTLILKTPTAIIGVSGTDFGVITCRHETKVIVFEGIIQVASSNMDLIKSVKLSNKEEVTILKNKPPQDPIVVPGEIFRSWIDYYEVVDNKNITIREKKGEGIIDKILRKKDL